MKRWVVRLISRPWQAAIRWYLRKPRSYTYRGVEVTVMPGVFHPGFFFSTRFLLDFLYEQDVQNQYLLELGCGSGIISAAMAKKGAIVTASDISTLAVNNVKINAKRNHVPVLPIHSDLFENIPVRVYDWIIINPPYYPADAHDEATYAWYCGRNHEYFRRLFSSLAQYTSGRTRVLMVLSDVCDLLHIFSIAGDHEFYFEVIAEREIWTDGKNYLYWIRRK